MRYEDMKKDPREAIVQVAKFLGKFDGLSDEMLNRIVEATSFGSMKTNKSVNYDWVEKPENCPGHIRKGIVGDWQNYFNLDDDDDQQLLEQFNNYIENNLPRELIFNDF